MLTTAWTAAIKSLNVSAKADGAHVVRRCRLRLQREFDDVLAAGIGPEAIRVRKALLAHSVSKAELPITAVEVDLDLVFGDQSCRVPNARGVRVVCTAPPEDDDEALPVATVDLEFPFRRDAWAWLGEHIAGYVEVTMTARQGDLFDGGEAA